MVAIGAGIIILIVLWLIALTVWLLSFRLGSPYTFAGFGTLVLVAIITVILWAIPKGPLPQDDPNDLVDHTYAGRMALIVISGIICFLGLVTIAVVHLFQQVYAVPLKVMIG